MFQASSFTSGWRASSFPIAIRQLDQQRQYDEHDGRKQPRIRIEDELRHCPFGGVSPDLGSPRITSLRAQSGFVKKNVSN